MRGYTNKTWESTFNPKKNLGDRRRRPKQEEPKSTFVEIKTKSQAGVEYTHYKRVFTPAPSGYNRSALRASLAKY